MSADIKKSRFTIVEFVSILVIVVIALALLISAVQRSRENTRRQACKDNMKQIGLALHSYNEANKRFPASAKLCRQPYNNVGGLSFLLEIIVFGPYDTYSRYDGTNDSFLVTKINNPAANTLPTFCLTDKDAKLPTARDTLIPEYLCPSNPNKHYLFPNNTAPGTKIALTNYKAMGATNMVSLSHCLNPDDTTAQPSPPIPVVPSQHPDGVLFPGKTNMVSLSYCLDPDDTTAQPSPPIPVVPSQHPDGVLFPGKGIRIGEVLDGTAHTVMVVETIDDSGTTQSDAGSAWISGACATLVALPSQNSGKQITYEPSDERYPFIRPTGFNWKYGEDAGPIIRSLRTYLAYDFSGADKGKYPGPATGTIVGNTPKNLYGPSSGTSKHSESLIRGWLSAKS